MSDRKKKVILWILTLAWAGVIFFFSSQSGDESASLSGGITQAVVRIFVKGYDALSPDRQLEIMDTASFIVRKLAHFTEYAVLGFLLYNLAGCYVKRKRSTAFALGALYAVTDEVHQMFSEGRSPQLRDVCIDSAGVLAGVFLGTFAFFVLCCIDKRRKKGLL